MYADLHCDTFYKCFSEGLDFFDSSLHINRGNTENISPYIQTFAHYIPESVPDKFDYFQKMLENSLKIIDSCDKLLLFKDYSDIEKAEKENKILAVLSVEGGDFFGKDKQTDLKRITFLEDNFIRFLSLSYNNGTDLCSGAMNRTDSGISDKGLSVAASLWEHNIVSDVSHLSSKAAKTLLDTEILAVATHSNCLALCDHPRNLDDYAICKLIEKNGLCGVNLYTPFLGGKSLSSVIAHIDRIIELGGENIVAFGCDFDGCDELPKGIQDVSDVSKLYKLCNGNNSLFYNNVKNFLKNFI